MSRGDSSVDGRAIRAAASPAAPIVWASAADPRIVTFWGALWAERTGIAVGEALGERWLSALHPDDRARGEEARTAAAAAGTAYSVEYRLRTRAGDLWVLDRGEPARGDDGRVIGWYGSLTDIDHLRGAASGAEARFLASVDVLLDCYGIFTAIRDASGAIVDFRIEYLNPAACRNNGRTLEEQVGRGLCELLPAHRETGLLEAYRRVVETGETLDREMMLYADDYAGEQKARWFDIRAVRLHDGFVAAWRDVTSRRREAEALRRGEERLRRFAESGVIGVVFSDTRGGVRFANDEYLRIVGYSREEFEGGGLGWKELTPPEWLPADARAIAEARERGVCTPYEKQYVRKDGGRVWVLIGYTLLDWPQRSDEAVAFVLDLSKRKRVERALHDTVEELQTVMDVLPVAVMIGHDRACTTITGNPAAHALMGVPLGANLSKTPGPGEPPARYVVLRDGRPAEGHTLPMQRAAGTGQVVSGEAYELRFVDGRVVHLMCHAAPLFAEGGEVRGCLGAFIDVTEHKQMAEAQRRSGEQWRLIAESIPHMVWSARADGSTDYYNQRFLDYLGISIEDMRGWTWVSTLHPEDGPRAAEAWRQAFADGDSFEIEYRIRRADGEFRWHLGRALPLRDADGAIVRWYGTCTDVHDRRVMDAALRESEERFRRAVAVSPHPIMIHAEDGSVVGINRAWEELAGYPAEALKTIDDWTARAYGTRQGAARAVIDRLYETDMVSREGEFQVTTASGATRTWEFQSAPLGRDVNGRRLVISTAVDVTERKTMEERLRAADRRKDEFLSQLAHELRNPLAPLRNALEILRLGPTPETLTRVTAVMDRQLRQMVSLLDDLLDVSRIRTGKIQLRPAPTDLAAAVRQAVEACEPALRQAGHALTVDLSGEPLALVADPTRMVQVVSNLLTNAIRYTPPGGAVSVTAAREGAWAVLRVSDTGIGIPADMLERVFDLFTQVHTDEMRAGGGLGIGLSLVKTLVEVHGGAVAATSAGPGRGSTFSVRLPLAAAAAVDERPAPSVASGAGLSVLVVDDNTDAADSLVVLLELSGHRAWAAYDGPSGLAAIERLRPELVLLDLGLPGMDGFAVARAARERGAGGPYIAALSGWGQEVDRRRSREAGFDAHLVKPVSSEGLAALLAAVMARRGG